MDSNVISIIALVISVTSSIINMINHTRVRSHCCDKKMEMSLDIDKTKSKRLLSASDSLNEFNQGGTKNNSSFNLY